MREIHSQADLEDGIAALETMFKVKTADLTLTVCANITLQVVANVSPTIAVPDNGSPTVIVLGSSSPLIKASGNSRPTVEAIDTSCPTIKASDDSCPTIIARGLSNPIVTAVDASRPTIEAWENSRPIIHARDNSRPSVLAKRHSRPTITATGNSSPIVRAWEESSPTVWVMNNARPTIEAMGFVLLRLYGKQITARLSPSVVCLCHGPTESIQGGQVFQPTRLRTPRDWCEHWGVPIVDGVATLYKAVDVDFRSQSGAAYTPGSTPIARDGDGEKPEGGRGLYFSPRPWIAKEFFPNARRFVACPVAFEDLAEPRSVHHPRRIEARGCCEPVWECDENGHPIGDPATHSGWHNETRRASAAPAHGRSGAKDVLPVRDSGEMTKIQPSLTSENISEDDAAMDKAAMDEIYRRKQIVKEYPEPLQSALKYFVWYHRGVYLEEEFRWRVFEHIRRDDLTLLEDGLRKLFGDPADGTPHIKSLLQDLLNDADWGIPLFARGPFPEDMSTTKVEAEIATAWERHRAGIAAVKEYLEGRTHSQQQ